MNLVPSWIPGVTREQMVKEALRNPPRPRTRDFKSEPKGVMAEHYNQNPYKTGNITHPNTDPPAPAPEHPLRPIPKRPSKKKVAYNQELSDEQSMTQKLEALNINKNSD